MTTANLSAEHQDFYQRFQSFWDNPSGPRVAEIIRPDATIHFTGQGSFSGQEYVDVMAGMLEMMDTIQVRPLDWAGNGDILYVHWKASAMFGEERREWLGVDRFRIKDGMAIEEHVIFDSAALQTED